MKKGSLIIPVLLSLLIALTACGKSVSYNPGTYEGKGEGYGGTLVLSVTVDADGKISDIQPTQSGETPEVGGLALETLTKMAIEKQKDEVDAVAAATMTSQAFNQALKEALDQATVK